eukprot:gnl/TRDRNA2_/TRDRNA2_177962_c5_seq3.p1 gnl/TRDRNA2_/TRDRNA2_177962_c5~~gnl/TRDRNA2_/TRDRNA2_177962_c5_seq3.p1  ORF type:complete len:562 (-),score=52.90 gnl/TRDRNA2_/TRDRNA2_177962_c5_seq3:303-1988(-)
MENPAVALTQPWLRKQSMTRLVSIAILVSLAQGQETGPFASVPKFNFRPEVVNSQGHDVDTATPESSATLEACLQDHEALSLLQTKAQFHRQSRAIADSPVIKPMIYEDEIDLIRRDPRFPVPYGQAHTTGIIHRERKIRPAFRKLLRCTGPGPSLSDCEECGGPVDCFYDCEHTYIGAWNGTQSELCVRSSSTSSFTRFVITAHVECLTEHGGMARVDIRQNELTGGTMKTFWNQKDVTDLQRDHEGWTQLRAESEGGNTLEIEVMRQAGQDVSTRLWYGSIIVAHTYGTCMDTTHCLNTLDESVEGRALRASNMLLRQCLYQPLEKIDSLPIVGQACSSFRECLREHGQHTLEHMRLILSAAALAKGGGSNTPEQSSCIHPPSEDPMGWDCDCFQEMHDRCLAIGASKPRSIQACLRAQFCLHPNICVSWRDAVCRTRKTNKFKKRLNKLDAQTALANAMKVKPDPSYKDPSSECPAADAMIPLGGDDGQTWRCKGGFCLQAKGRCNGVRQCGDGSDEEGCSQQEFLDDGPMHLVSRSAVKTSMTGKQLDTTAMKKSCN